MFSNNLNRTSIGIGPTYASKMLRLGLRFSDLSDESGLRDKVFRVVNDIKLRFPNRDVDPQREFEVLFVILSWRLYSSRNW